jgi:hypothetical protein
MPFDSMPIIEAPKRPFTVDGATFDLGFSRPTTGGLKTRPIPRWHSSLHAERIDSTLTVLTRARELIRDERRWCRRTYARGWRGLPVPVQSSAAHRFCAVGALLRAGRELGLPVEDARNALEWQTIRPVQDWNDDPARTHHEVMAAFDAAVVALEKSAIP